MRAATQAPSPCTHLLQNGAGQGPDPGGNTGNGVFRPLPSSQKPHRKLQSHHSINSQSSKKSKGSSKSASSHIPIEAQEGTTLCKGNFLCCGPISHGVSYVASSQLTRTLKLGSSHAPLTSCICTTHPSPGRVLIGCHFTSSKIGLFWGLGMSQALREQCLAPSPIPPPPLVPSFHPLGAEHPFTSPALVPLLPAHSLWLFPCRLLRPLHPILPLLRVPDPLQHRAGLCHLRLLHL